MGAVIGGAIGSVIGVTIAPEKGKKTRETTKKIFAKIKNIFKRTDTIHEMKKIPSETLKDPKEANK